MVTFHHPKKKHFFGVWKDDTDYDPAKPFMPLTKIKLRIDQYPMLDFAAVSDTEFIVNVPLTCKAGDPIPVIVCEKITTIPCPHLDRKESRFIVCFVEKDKRVTWAKSVSL